ncbi:Fur family transcriptional regulator [Spongisporangium articulatum]|uniref:Fur family transcriptional regulator n=1 Tax=Spongisporangium articulatum TaxID=3362603 RepID=A0ABW8AJR8_9ACTN
MSVSPESLDATLRARGMRATPQRRAVLCALDELGHATPEQLEEHLRAHPADDVPAANLSTVYRTLELLEELGLVSHTHLNHTAPTYQVAAHADHFHLVCRGCGRLTETDLEPARALAAAIEAEHGFTADLAHLSLHGWCADCREANRAAERLHHHD